MSEAEEDTFQRILPKQKLIINHRAIKLLYNRAHTEIKIKKGFLR